MPQIHDPEDPKGGPGSAFLSTTLSSKVRRRRKKQRTNSSSKEKEEGQEGLLIGEDMVLDFDDEWPRPFTTAVTAKPPAPIVVKEKKKFNKVPANTPKRLKTTPPALSIDNNNHRRALNSKEKGTARSSHVTPAPSSLKPSPSTSVASSTSMHRPSSSACVRHALVVDTRALETVEGMATLERIRQQILSFLSTLNQRGVSPSILAFSQVMAQSNKTQRANARVVMECKAVAVPSFALNQVEDWIRPVPIQPPSNAGNKENRNAVHTPKRLLAHDSWKLFGDLVETVVREDQANFKLASSVSVPFDVCVLTNDVSFLCDTKQESHKRGLNSLWKRVRPLFESGFIRSIEIVVAETGSVVLADRRDKDEHQTKENQNDSIETLVDTKSPQEPADDSQPSNTQEIATVQCIQGIKFNIAKRAEEDYKKNRGSDDPPAAVVVRLTSIPNNHVGYVTLVQQWVRDRLALPRDKGRLSFEMPETVDGMDCSLSFEATYKVFPFRADSIAATGLMTDLELLAESSFQVIQLVPLSCIDASLIFGVPITVCAKLEHDLAQYKEMKALVSCLFQYLSEKDVALVLRSTDTNDIKSLNVGSPLYHASGQIFLLMAEELPGRNLMDVPQSQPDVSSATRAAPATGVLVRYASAEHLVDSGASKTIGPDGDVNELTNEFAEYVENSLDFLENSSMNPFLINSASRARHESSTQALATEGSDSASADDTPWNDNAGVGAQVRAKASDAEVDSFDVYGESDNDDDWNTFSY